MKKIQLLVNNVLMFEFRDIKQASNRVVLFSAPVTNYQGVSWMQSDAESEVDLIIHDDNQTVEKTFRVVRKDYYLKEDHLSYLKLYHA